MVLFCNTSPAATSIHSPPHTTISALISAWWLRVAPKACISSSQKCHCVTFPPFAFGPRAGPFSNSSALQIPRIYLPSFSSSSLPVWRKDREASWPGLFRAHLLVASSLLPPQGKRGGGGVCLSTTALRIPLPDPSSPRAPIPEWRVPAQRPSSPDELQTRHVTGCHSWYPPPDPLQTTSSLHRNVLGLSPNGQPCRKCGWQALGPLPSSMHAALLIPALAFQIRESAWPCWDMAELWRPPSMATMMPPLLAALPCSPCAAAERTMYEARPIFTGTSSPQLRADKIHPSAIVQLEP